MPTSALRLAQWMPSQVPNQGDTVVVSQVDPFDTEFVQADFPEAPVDGKQYGRQNEGWTAVPPLPFATDAPSDGNRYGRRNGAWDIVPNPQPDAPADGKEYARRNNAWVNLDSYATDAELAAAIAANTIPDAPNDGRFYARRSRAWAESVGEAPADGKQYARQDKNWATVVPANAITVDDAAPAAPKYGDRWIRPSDGQDATWVPTTSGSGTWVDTDSASMLLSPVPVASGGTNATTAPAARVNLGLDNVAGQRLIPTDGTAAAPGLAWASETGLGWWRTSAGRVQMAYGGQGVHTVNASVAGNTGMSVTPRAYGSSQFSVNTNPSGSADNRSFGMSIDGPGAGAAFLSLNYSGTAVGQVIPLKFAGAQNYQFDNAIVSTAGASFKSTVAIEGILELGPVAGSTDAIIDFKNNAGDDFDIRIAQYGATPGWLRFTGSGTVARYQFQGSGAGICFENIDAQSGSNTIAFGWRSDGYLGLRVDTTQFGSTWPINIVGRAGSAGWSDDGNWCNTARNCERQDSVLNWGFASNNRMQPYMRTSGNEVRQLVVNKGDINGLLLEGATGRLITYNVNDSAGLWIQGNWVSDIRMKRDIAPATREACADVKAMEFIAFNYDPEKTPLDPNIRYDIGFSAQNLQGISEQYVADMDGTLSPRDEILLPAAFKAIQELLARNEALESRIAALEAA